jgi:hypothetical protein
LAFSCFAKKVKANEAPGGCFGKPLLMLRPGKKQPLVTSLAPFIALFRSCSLPRREQGLVGPLRRQRGRSCSFSRSCSCSSLWEGEERRGEERRGEERRGLLVRPFGKESKERRGQLVPFLRGSGRRREGLLLVSRS